MLVEQFLYSMCCSVSHLRLKAYFNDNPLYTWALCHFLHQILKKSSHVNVLRSFYLFLNVLQNKHENIICIYDIMTDPPNSPDFDDIYIVTNLMESDLGSSPLFPEKY